MATLKYSRQREVIKEYLASTKEHPTADTVYLHVRKTFPKISLGTVYRNLAILESLGQVRRLSFDTQAEHYDGHTHPHYHMYCKNCGAIIDLELGELSFLDQLAASCCEGRIEEHSIYFYGLCSKCKD